MFKADRAARRRQSPALQVLLLVLLLLILDAILAGALYSASNFSFASVSSSSVTLSMKAAVDNSYSPLTPFSTSGSRLTAGEFLTSAAFRVYGDGVLLSNVTIDNYFPSQGSNSTGLVTITIPYSGVEALFRSQMVSGHAVSYALRGTAMFLTPVGLVSLPLNINTTAPAAPAPVGALPSQLESAVTVLNTPLVAVFESAVLQVDSNGILLFNGTSTNSLPGGSGGDVIPKVSTVTTEIHSFYGNAATLIGSYVLHGGASNPTATLLARFESWTEVGGAQLNVQTQLPIYISLNAVGYPLHIALLAALILVAALGLLLHRRDYL